MTAARDAREPRPPELAPAVAPAPANGDLVSISLGGSILVPDAPDVDFLGRFCDLLGIQRQRLGAKFLVVTGGGGPARRTIRAAREFGASEEECDRVGIATTRVNATLAALALSRKGKVNVRIPDTVEDAARMAASQDFVVMGGTVPGHSTDYVGAALALAAKASLFVILTNVDGVYTADPKMDPAAKRLARVTPSEFARIADTGEWTAGKSGVADPPCARLIKERNMRVAVLDGRRLAELERCLNGEPFLGTLVSPSRT